LSYLGHTQTDRQTNSGKNITSLADVKVKNLLHWKASGQTDNLP